MKEIPVQSIDDWSARITPESDPDDLSSSLALHGQLSPIKVRSKQVLGKERYQVIFGNRRLAAARKLNWNTVLAEIVEVTDEEAMIMAFCENADRKDLCDYERALYLERIHKLGGKSYSEIAQLIGKSSAYISQHIAMIHLFPRSIAAEENIQKVLCSLTESHTRILGRIEDHLERWNMAKFSVSANLSVRELQKFCGRSKASDLSTSETEDHAIRRIIAEIITGFNKRDMRPYLAALSENYFDIFVVLPRFNKLDAENAKSYVHKVLAKVDTFRETLQDLNVRLFGKLAVVTLNLGTEMAYAGKKVKTRFRATIIFEKRNNWKIVHEHWSADNPGELLSLLDNHGELTVVTKQKTR